MRRFGARYGSLQHLGFLLPSGKHCLDFGVDFIQAGVFNASSSLPSGLLALDNIRMNSDSRQMYENVKTAFWPRATGTAVGMPPYVFRASFYEMERPLFFSKKRTPGRLSK